MRRLPDQDAQQDEERKQKLLGVMLRVLDDTDSTDMVQATNPDLKSSAMRGVLRLMGIQGSIRVDEASAKISVIDVIRAINPRRSVQYASNTLNDLLRSEDDFSDRIVKININGKGAISPVADILTIIEMMLCLPGPNARRFSYNASMIMSRVLGGDKSLCHEIREWNAFLQSTSDGKSFQEILLSSRSSTK